MKVVVELAGKRLFPLEWEMCMFKMLFKKIILDLLLFFLNWRQKS